MKDRGVWMILQKFRPSQIGKGINSINSYHSIPIREDWNEWLQFNLQSVSVRVNVPDVGGDGNQCDLFHDDNRCRIFL